jgi:hypothetical protein
MEKVKILKENKEKIFEQDKTSKEIKGIQDAIDKYVKKHDGNVAFHGCFMAFDKKTKDVIDDIYFCFGPKDVVKISVKAMEKELKEEKDDFVNW